MAVVGEAGRGDAVARLHDLQRLLVQGLIAGVALQDAQRMGVPTPAASTGFATSEATDPYVWLEDVEGERAME